ncbi:hypothetical protein D3C80_793120 [compost metagenome]
MFNGGQDTTIHHTVHISFCFFGDIIFIIAKRTNTDDRIFRVVIDVHIWCKIEMHTDTMKIQRNLTSHAINQLIILHSTKCHLIRE